MVEDPNGFSVLHPLNKKSGFDYALYFLMIHSHRGETLEVAYEVEAERWV